MEGLLSILADLFIVFVAAKLAGEIFTRLNQPAVIGELLAGIIIGPFVLGWVGTPDAALIEAFHGDLAAAREALDLELELFAELGVIVLLFFVGLETRLSDLVAVGPRSLLVATLGVVVPFAAGYGVMNLRGEPTVGSLFVAVALVATSVGITARVLRDLGALDSREARIILGAAVIDDILALILLAIVTDLGRTGEFHALAVAETAVLAIGFTIVAALVGTRLVRRYFHHCERLQLNQGPLMVALGLMLGLALVASLVGLAAIIGAFLAGMMLAEAGEHFELKRAALPIYEFFVPFFFVITGTHVDPGLFLDGAIIGVALLITVVAILGKLIGAGLGGYGMGLRSSAILGTGMVPRGEVGLIVASIGLSLGVISQSIFSVVVVMSLLTTVVVPPALSLLYRAQTTEKVLTPSD